MYRRGALTALLIAAMLALTPAPPAVAATAHVEMVGIYRGVGESPGEYVGTGLPGEFRLSDEDIPRVVRRMLVRVTSNSDTVGIPVWTDVDAWNSGMFSGSFRFSTTASDPLLGVLKVADGDAVTVTYLDPDGNAATSVKAQGSAPWHAGSAMPDFRELSFHDADPTAPVVLGAWRSVAPGAAVKVYSSEDALVPLGSGTAASDGSFEVTLPPFVVRPDKLWVAATEGDEDESVRVGVDWAAVTGRVVRPDDDGPVWTAFAHVDNASPITNTHGRYDMKTAAFPEFSGDGDFTLEVEQQTTNSPASPWQWRSSAYGNPPAQAFSHDGENTLDLGDTELLPPNFFGRVRAGLIGIGDVDLFLSDPDTGEGVAGGGHTRSDGRFAFHLLDGDYRIKFTPPPGCGGFAMDRSIVVSVVNGVATPPTADVDVALGGSSLPTATVPIVGGGNSAPVGVDLVSPAGPVSVTLNGAVGDGQLKAGCASLGDRPDILEVAPPLQLTASGVSFSSSDVCVGYDPAALAAQGISVSKVQLYHFTPSGKAEVITGSRDTVDHEICGRTTSFSPFAIGVPTGAPPPTGYWMLEEGGTVHAFGAAGSYGGTAEDVVDIEPTPTGKGYWILTAGGAVRTRGDAKWLGSVGQLRAGEYPTSLSAVPTGNGYWIFTSHGRAVAFGAAPVLKDMSGTPLNGPVLDSVATPTGKGYYMVGSDGGVFAFGDAAYRGSMGGQPLNAPVQSLVPDGDGLGYWLVASDGGVFSYDAPFRGSMGAVPLNGPVTGMVRFGNGYLMVGTDGGIFNFSDRQFAGSLGGNPPARPIVSVAATP